MAEQRSRGARLTALVIAAGLIGGGATALSTGTPLATKICAAVAILVGLLFLLRARRVRS